MKKSTVYNYPTPQEADIELIIPENVYYKIQQWCLHIPDKEWSGILFYKVKGNFETSLTLTCKDIYVCNIGSSAFTSFDHKPEIIRYADEHNLLDCFHALIHSHNHMNSFFSGTDNNTLKEQGEQMPHFLSLIVNNSMKMTAKITRMVIYKALSYNTYKGKNIKMKKDALIESLQTFDVKIKLPISNNTVKEIQERIEELRAENPSTIYSTGDHGFPYYKEEKEDWEYPKYPSMFSYKKTTSPASPEPSFWSESEENSDIYEEEGTEIPKDIFMDLMAKITTCNLSATMDDTDIDVETLVINYDSLFEKDLDAVRAFLTGFLYYLVNHVKKDATSDKYIRPRDVCDQLLDCLKDMDYEEDYIKTIIDVLIELP